MTATKAKAKSVKITADSFASPRVSTHTTTLNKDGKPEPFDTAHVCIMDAAQKPALTITPKTFVHQEPRFNHVNECWYLWIDVPPGVKPPEYTVEFSPRGFPQKELRQKLTIK